MSDMLRFCPSVSLEDLNPMNHALRNDYISNLIGLGFNLTVLEMIIKKSITIINGFKSQRSKPHKHFEFDKYLCAGKAIEITVDNYELLVMMDVVKKMKKNLLEKNISVVLFEDSVMLISDFDDKCGIYRFDGKPIMITEY